MINTDDCGYPDFEELYAGYIEDILQDILLRRPEFEQHFEQNQVDDGV